MKYKDRNGNFCGENDSQDKLLKQLYTTVPGRFVIKFLVHPAISKLSGMFLNSPASIPFIKPFVKKNSIDLEDYLPQHFSSYNAFFTRKIKENKRPVDLEPTSLISPCDSKLTAYPITSKGSVTIKNTPYTLSSLLKNKELASHYEGGIMLVFRLTVSDYHHYCYVDSGKKGINHKIPGVFHTVNPIANDYYPIYKENTREYSFLMSEHFGTILTMEVGALMVGKIVNLQERASVKKGQEKGYFEFGGSTVVICLEKNKAVIDEDIIKNSQNNIETAVVMGEKIGTQKPVTL